MLAFVGLGLYDRKDISVRGLELVREADFVFLESYTSVPGGADASDLEAWYGRGVRTMTREMIEVDPDEILALAEESRVVLLTGGDPMVSTTHTDLRMRACRRGIETAIIHGSSISTAVCGLSGLQNYRFAKSCSLPFRHGSWAPEAPIDVIAGNLSRDLHTLVYLDISGDRCYLLFRAPEGGGRVRLPGVVEPVFRLAPEHPHHFDCLPVVATLSAVAGILVAWYLYLSMPDVRASVRRALSPLLRVFAAKYWFDDVYDGFVRYVVVDGSRGFLWQRFDAGFIDGIVNGSGRAAAWLGQATRPIETGSARHYALLVLAGAVALVSYLLWS